MKKSVVLSSLEIEHDVNRSEKEITDRANSIEAVGLLQPIILNKEMTKVIAGRTRTLAMLQLGWDKVTNTDENVFFTVSENDEDIVSFVENESRKQMTDKEEINAMLKFKEKYKTVKIIAEKMGKTCYWVSRRLVIEDLIEKGKEIFLGENKRKQLLAFSLKHWVIIAKQTDDNQEKILNSISLIEMMTPEKLAKWVNSTCHWKVEDYPFDGCGTCELCTENEDSYLFQDMHRAGYCGDIDYLEKMKDEELEKQLIENSGLKRISESYDNKESNYSHYSGDILEEPVEDDKCERMLIIDGKDRGKVVWFLPNQWSSDKLAPEKDEAPPEKTIAEKIVEKETQKQKYFIELIEEILDKKPAIKEEKKDFLINALGLEMVFGAWNDEEPFGIKTENHGLLFLEELNKLSNSEYIELIGKIAKDREDRLRESCFTELDIFRDYPLFLRKCKVVCECIELLNFNDLNKMVEEKYPMPKAWTDND